MQHHLPISPIAQFISLGLDQPLNFNFTHFPFFFIFTTVCNHIDFLRWLSRKTHMPFSEIKCRQRFFISVSQYQPVSNSWKVQMFHRMWICHHKSIGRHFALQALLVQKTLYSEFNKKVRERCIQNLQMYTDIFG